MAREFPRLDSSRLFRVEILVYRQRPQNEAALRQKITAVSAQITPELLRATWRNLSARYELCRIGHGGHVEC
jgi:hypothetical protein